MHPKLRLKDQYRKNCVHQHRMTSMYCMNCGVTQTPLWRKVQDQNMCNACGIYWKTHGHHRPLIMITGRYVPRKKRMGSLDEPETPRKNALRQVLHGAVEKKIPPRCASLELLSEMAEEMRKKELNECARQCIFFGVWEKS